MCMYMCRSVSPHAPKLVVTRQSISETPGLPHISSRPAPNYFLRVNVVSRNVSPVRIDREDLIFIGPPRLPFPLDSPQSHLSLHLSTFVCIGGPLSRLFSYSRLQKSSSSSLIPQNVVCAVKLGTISRLFIVVQFNILIKCIKKVEFSYGLELKSRSCAFPSLQLTRCGRPLWPQSPDARLPVSSGHR